jgi:cytoskeleton protein RodZ
MQLKTARCKLGLRLLDVGRELRISVDYLKLLEGGDFDQLPAPTYVSGFLRSYGKFVGLDAAELASRFYVLQGNASAKMCYKLPVTGGPPQRSAPAVASLCVVMAVVVYGGWYWMSGPKTSDAALEIEQAATNLNRLHPGMMEKNAVSEAFEGTPGEQADNNGSENTGASVTLPGDAARIETLQTISPVLKAGTKTTTDTTAMADMDNVAHGDVSLKSMKQDTVSLATSLPAVNEKAEGEYQVPQLASRNTPNSGTSDRKDMADGPLVPGRGAAVATIRVPAQEMTVRAISSSWVEVVRSDGTSVLKKLMKAGDTYVFDDSTGLYLSTGNAGGIEIITGNNETFTIGSVGEIVRDLPLIKSRLRDRF